MELSKCRGTVLAEVTLCDSAGQIVTDAATLSAGPCLLVAECVSRYLQQLDGLGFGDETEIQRLTNLMAINVIRAANGSGKGLADDVRVTAPMLGFDLLPVDGRKAGRMDS